jgi:hypothetical protein
MQTKRSGLMSGSFFIFNSAIFSSFENHMLALRETHLRRLIRDYISYYHADRTHDSLEKDSPAMRPVSGKPDQSARLVSFPPIGGLHHRYDSQQAD